MTIGGTLNTDALRRLHFSALSPREQAAAVRRLAASGQSDEFIADATGMALEMVRRVLEEKSHGL
jgi:hypothetical protein